MSGGGSVFEKDGSGWRKVSGTKSGSATPETEEPVVRKTDVPQSSDTMGNVDKETDEVQALSTNCTTPDSRSSPTIEPLESEIEPKVASIKQEDVPSDLNQAESDPVDDAADSVAQPSESTKSDDAKQSNTGAKQQEQERQMHNKDPDTLGHRDQEVEDHHTPAESMAPEAGCTPDGARFDDLGHDDEQESVIKSPRESQADLEVGRPTDMTVDDAVEEPPTKPSPDQTVNKEMLEPVSESKTEFPTEAVSEPLPALEAPQSPQAGQQKQPVDTPGRATKVPDSNVVKQQSSSPAGRQKSPNKKKSSGAAVVPPPTSAKSRVARSHVIPHTSVTPTRRLSASPSSTLETPNNRLTPKVRPTRTSLSPSKLRRTPALKPSHTGNTQSTPPPALKPHHTGMPTTPSRHATPLRPQVTGTRAIERSPLYAPTASSLAKTKPKVTLTSSTSGSSVGGGATERSRKTSLDSLKHEHRDRRRTMSNESSGRRSSAGQHAAVDRGLGQIEQTVPE